MQEPYVPAADSEAIYENADVRVYWNPQRGAISFIDIDSGCRINNGVRMMPDKQKAIQWVEGILKIGSFF